ncbi:MAG: ubiquinol-cytochrome c reductase iron-sulfur subunit [Acidobacteriaceae bacterium]|nr:ubiquinol-cytochrome c reductase iron-sulfur subunit [Acidobacteriaceae bacterium]
MIREQTIIDGCTDTPASVSVYDRSRRRLLITGIRAFWGLITAALGVPAAHYLLSTPKSRVADEWAGIGDAAMLPAGRPVEVVFHRNGADAWKKTEEKLTAWVTRGLDSKVLAFGPRCTHLGCAHHWDDTQRQFVCPCHNSRFSIAGDVVAGPASRPLDRYQVKLESGKVFIGKLTRSDQIL